MTKYVFNIPAFRLSFPVFANATQYPDPTIQNKADMAQLYLTEGCSLSGAQYDQAVQLMTAHLLWTEKLLLSGQTTVGVMTGATISKVSVSLAAPPTRTAWQYWLSTTPYGMQLWSLLMLVSAGGWYIGGSPERKAFRKVGGSFQ